MSTAVLEVKDLRIVISSPGRTSTPVNGVQFEVGPGEIVSLVGESGCGKTTMAMAVAGLLPDGGEVVEGDIVLGGRSLRAMSSAEARKARTDQVGVVFQSPSTALNPRLEIGAQLREALPPEVRRSGARARRACVELLGLTGVPQPADRLADYPHELSVGLAQRVVIAMALARQPLLLVADEPTSALDVGIQAQVLDLITGLQRQLNLSVLLITHDIGIVSERADRVAVMYGGQIMEQGVTSDVLNAPVHPYTAALLRALPTLTDVHAPRLPTIDGTPPDLRLPVLGCPFAPRCAHASERCGTTRPTVEVSADGRRFGCFHPLPAAAVQPDADADADADAREDAARADASVVPARGRPGGPGAEPPAAAEAIVEVRNVSREFVVRTGLRSRQVRSAVADVSLELLPGETLGIVGESGCGKSTLGRMLAGLDFPTSGAIYYKGQEIRPGARRQRAWRGDIQLIYQNAFTSLDPRMTAADILAEPLRYRHNRAPDRQRRVRSLVEEVGLPDSVLRRRPGQLSGGERQRIGIARALALDPSVIVADEVVSALDASAQAKILNLFKSLQESRGLSYVFISHDLRVVSFLCDRVAVIYLGKVVECGQTRQLINSPAHPYTAALLSSVPGSPAAEARLNGELPSVENPPAGCRYHTRCALATSRCAEVPPALAEIGHGHAVACHFPIQEVTGDDSMLDVNERQHSKRLLPVGSKEQKGGNMQRRRRAVRTNTPLVMTGSDGDAANVGRRRHRHRVAVMAAVAALAATTLAACQGSNGAASSSGGGASTIKIAVPSAFGTLDPNVGLQVDAEVSVQSDLFSSLVQVNPQLKIVGDMATSWQNPSPTVWEFTLRPGMKFQNGDPLDASTVVANFQRMSSKALGSKWISDLTPYIQSVTAPDATTVKFQLKSPYTDFLYRLSYIFYIDTAWVNGHNPKLEANASGPYELVSFDPQSQAVLKANPSYYGKKPAYKNVSYIVEPTSTAEINALQTGAVDVATKMAPNDMKSLNSDQNLTTGSEASLRNVFLWMTTVKGGPLANKLVRQAMNYAVDKQAIVNSIFDGKTSALKGQVLNPTYNQFNTSLEGYPYNPAKAKQLLAQAGYPHGFSTEMTYPTGTYPADDLVSQVLVQQYAAVGITLKLNAIPFTSFVTMNVNAKTQATPLRYEGYASYTPSSAGMLYFFTSDHYTNAAPDPQYDALVNKYLTAPNAAQEQQYFNETTAEMYDDAPMVFLFAQPLTYAHSKSVQWTPRPDDWLRAYDMAPATS